MWGKKGGALSDQVDTAREGGRMIARV